MSLDYKQLKISFEQAFKRACNPPSDNYPTLRQKENGQYDDDLTEASWFFYVRGAEAQERWRENEH